MLKMKIKNKKENGYILVTTLIAIVFISIIGVSLLRVAYSDYINTNFYIKHRQAYFVARSGAEAVQKWIENKDNDSSVLDGKTTGKIDLGPGTYQITVHKNGNIYTIESIGKVDDVEKSVGVDVEKINNPGLQHTVFADKILGVGNVFKGNNDYTDKIFDIGTNLPSDSPDVNLHQEIIDNVDVEYNMGYTYTLPVWPEEDFQTTYDNLINDTIDSLDYTDNRVDFDKIKNNNNEITINVDGNEDLNIYVNELDIKDNIVVNTNGDGNVNIYVKDKLSINSQAAINEDGDTNDLNIYHYNKDDKIKLSAKRTLNANLYTQSDNIDITGQGEYYGNIFAFSEGSIKLTGNGSGKQSIIYAPKSTIELTGNSEFSGAIVGKELDIKGSAMVYGDPSTITLPGEYEPQISVTWRDI